MRSTLRRLPLLVAALLLMPFLSPLAADGAGGTVTGDAVLDGVALAGATIAVDCAESSAYTGTATADEAGHFEVAAVPVGAFSISVFDADEQLVLQGSGVVEADGDTVTVALVPPQE